MKKGISKRKNSKAAGSSVIVVEMLKVSGEAGIDLAMGVANSMGVVPVKWELSSIGNCYKGEGDVLE